MPRILRFRQLGREIVADEAETILQSARRAGVRIVGACGGRGTCGTCGVRVVEGEVATATPAGDATPGGWERACRLRARSDCVIDVAPRSLAAVVRTDVADDGSLAIGDFSPAVRAVDVAVAVATAADPRADADRVCDALPAGSSEHVDPLAARDLADLLRGSRQSDGRWATRVRVRGGEIIGFASVGDRSLGLAIDLGTTNVAGFLIDLEQGRRLASLGIENPQVAWGADVVSRINHAIRTAGGRGELRTAAAAAIDALARDLCQSVAASPRDIVDLAVCGNTAMHHLLLGLPVAQLGRAPFVAALREAVDLKARELGLATCPGAYVHLAPNIGGYVGGDHVSALLATEQRWTGVSTCLLIDIGTNTEISLSHRGELVSISCPSGPALEGGHIACGMRAAEGAIERVRWVGGTLEVSAIGGTAPVGLCGSGVLDALAALRQAGIVDARGRIGAGRLQVTETHGRRAVVLAPNVELTQDDVRAIQLAKAAIRAGIDLLLQQFGLRETEIDRFLIAGAFGAYLDVGSAVAIGLLPALPAGRFELVGNAAGAGVRRMLASARARQQAAELARRSRYLELGSLPEFQATFLQRLALDTGFAAGKHRRPDRAAAT